MRQCGAGISSHGTTNPPEEKIVKAFEEGRMVPSRPIPAADGHARPPRTPGYKPALAAFAALAAAWVFVLVTLGAFTTTIGAGMAFPDWPLSNGSLNPAGWLTNLSMFAEHSHRLSAAVMTILTVVLAVWLWRTESRAWLRAVVLRGRPRRRPGGRRRPARPARPVRVRPVDTSLGQIFAMLHACLAQAFACTLIALAVSCSRGWITTGRCPSAPGSGASDRLLRPALPPAGDRGRHAPQLRRAGDPDLPLVDPEGGLLPAAWSFRVGIQFAHRVMACVIAVAVAVFAVAIWRDRGASLAMRSRRLGPREPCRASRSSSAPRSSAPTATVASRPATCSSGR
jgi:cytochrome c oxidase assembly protein subunit 15